MSVKIPFVAADDARPLARVIRDTANKMAMSEYLVAILFSHLFEGIATEIAMGNEVRVPCFGMFAPVRWEPRQEGREGYAVPYFCAAKGFRAEVRSSCSPYPSAERAFNRYRQRHRSPGEAERRRVFTGMKKYREIIEAQAREMGIDLELGS